MSSFLKAVFVSVWMLTAVIAVPCVSISQAYAENAKIEYVCPSCGLEQANSGTCPKCNANLQKMEVKYECASCGMAQSTPGNCSMCGTPLTEKKVPAA